MAEPGELTTGGLLYEGNFEEWLPRVSVLLKVKERVAREARTNKTETTDIRHQSDAEAYTFIKDLISPMLLPRIPEEILTDHLKQPHKRLEALKNYATPFRLADLPVEILGRICSFAVSSQLVNVRLRNGSLAQSAAVPNLARADRRCRSEALRVFYNKSIFYLDQVHSFGSKKNDNITRMDLTTLATDWAQTLQRSHTILLRSVQLCVVAEGVRKSATTSGPVYCKLRLHYDKIRGVTHQAEGPWKMKKPCADALEARLAIVNNSARALNLQG